jgi:CBS domain-containing protein
MSETNQFHCEVFTVNPSDTIWDAARLMRDEQIGAVVVVQDHDRRVVGILTDRDIAMHTALEGVPPSTPVEKIMTKKVFTMRDTGGLLNATQYFKSHQVRRLPVVNADDQLVGMVTLDDVLMLLADETKNMSQALSPIVSSKRKHRMKVAR